jgi:IS1 family transposase
VGSASTTPLARAYPLAYRPGDRAVNILPRHKQAGIVSALVEGCSIRAVERLTGVHRDTIMRLGVAAGEGCHALNDRLMRNLNVGVVELDEIWSYVGKKQKRLAEGDDRDQLGDQYVFVALDATRKAIISYAVGKRDGEATNAFCADLRARILNRPQITSDGFRPYVEGIELAFGADVRFAQLVKQYEGEPGLDAARRYSPGRVVGVLRTVVSGNPDPELISTSYVERQNLTMRMQSRRFTRLTNAFSKKLRNHKAAVALYVAHYNLCRVHEALRITPAMALGVADRVWSIGELVEAARAEKPAPLPPPRPAGRPVLRVIQGGLS